MRFASATLSVKYYLFWLIRSVIVPATDSKNLLSLYKMFMRKYVNWS